MILRAPAEGALHALRRGEDLRLWIVRADELHRRHSERYTTAMADANRVEVRCAKCREVDWRRGGRGRADLVAAIATAPTTWGRVGTVTDPAGTVYAHTPPDPRMTTQGVGWRKVSDPSAHRWRCRHSHRLRWDTEDVARQSARLGEVYLPVA